MFYSSKIRVSSVPTSDNNYIQYRCIAQSFTTNIGYWVRYVDVEEYTQTITGSTEGAIDYKGYFRKGSKLVVHTSSSNTKPLYMFPIVNGAYEQSIKIEIGDTLDMILPYDYNGIRLYHVDQSEWSADFTVYSPIQGVRVDLETEKVKTASLSTKEDNLEKYTGFTPKLQDTKTNVTSSELSVTTKKGDLIVIDSSAQSTASFYIFFYNDATSSWDGNYGTINPGDHFEILAPRESSSKILLNRKGNSGTWSADIVVNGQIPAINKRLAEIENVTPYIIPNLKDYTISETNITGTKDYIGNWAKGSKISVTANANNTTDIFMFNFEGSTVHNSIKIPAGQTVSRVLEWDSDTLRIYVANSSTVWSADIECESLISKLRDDVGDIKQELNGVAREYYKDKKLVTLGDSYGAEGKWQAKLVEIKGFDFDATLNNGRYSVGGTDTISSSETCGQMRARQLVADDQITPDVIIIENVNDNSLLTRAGSSTDSPYMIGDKTEVQLSGYTEEQTLEYFENNISTILSGVTAAHGHRVILLYDSGNTATVLTFSNAPTQNGRFYIRAGSAGGHWIDVFSTDTIADVIDKIMIYAWNRFVLSSTSNTVKFTPTLSPQYLPDYQISISQNTTGMTINVAVDQAGTLNAVMTYPLHDMTGWLNSENWVNINTITLWSAYKGLFNYLSEHFPLAEIFWMFPIAYNVNVESSTYQNADGTIDTDKVLTRILFGDLKTLQKNVCDYCQIPFWDLKEYACIYPQNVAQYFPANNYHPNDAGYGRWGIACAKFLL